MHCLSNFAKQERILLEPQFVVPDSDIQEVIINEGVIQGTESPQYVSREEQPAESENQEQRSLKV